MPSAGPRLSKSRLIAAWQCPKRLYLEKFHPELAEITDKMEAMFAVGHEVGAVARSLYGTPESVEIPFDRKTSRMVEATREILASGARFPIFEATFEYDGILVRADVLIPSGDGWRLVEVKASTSVKDYHVLDCAIQDWVLRNAGINVTSISLAHINNRFVYAGDGNYDGLLVKKDRFPGMDALKWLSAVAALAATLCASLAAYAITRLTFPGRLLIPLVLLAFSMFPQISIVGYLFKMMIGLGWINTYAGLIFPYITLGLPLALWIMLSTFSEISTELDRAALVDGATHIQILHKIILPLAAPGALSATLLVFIYSFNEFLFAMMLTTDYRARTIPVGIALLIAGVATYAFFRVGTNAVGGDEER